MALDPSNSSNLAQLALNGLTASETSYICSANLMVVKSDRTKVACIIGLLNLNALNVKITQHYKEVIVDCNVNSPELQKK